MVIFWVLGIFWSFFGFWGYFGYFLSLGGILVIFRFREYFGQFVLDFGYQKRLAQSILAEIDVDMLALLGKVRLLSSSSLHVGGGVQGPPRLFPTNNIPCINFFTINPCFFSLLSHSPHHLFLSFPSLLSFSSKFKLYVCTSLFHPCCLLFFD